MTDDLVPPTVTIGIRALRNDVAAVVRRARNGERLVVTVAGRPAAQLGPLRPSGTAALTDLVGAGLVEPPSSTVRPAARPPVLRFQMDSRPDRILREARGR